MCTFYTQQINKWDVDIKHRLEFKLMYLTCYLKASNKRKDNQMYKSVTETIYKNVNTEFIQ